MIYKLYGDTYAVRLERGEEVVASIAELCEKEGIRAGTVQGLGASDDATVGLYSIAEKKYYPTELKGDMEITALIGNISRQEGADAPYLHLHITLAKAGGQAVGGGRAVESLFQVSGEGGALSTLLARLPAWVEIGRASCRERVLWHV